MSTIKVRTVSDLREQDGLRIDKKRGKIQASLGAYSFVDKDTQQHIIYIPSVEISGYGSTLKEADKMIRESVKEFLEQIGRMPLDKIGQELSKLGWKRNPFHNKEFSNAYVDGDGRLQGLNSGSEIERLTLVA